MFKFKEYVKFNISIEKIENNFGEIHTNVELLTDFLIDL